MKQRTINKEIFIKGIGLHSGNDVSIQMQPAKIDSGVTFIYNDQQINANYLNATCSERKTIISNSQEEIHTIEHLMAALYATSVTNIIINIDSNEPPTLDGSSIEFIKEIQSVGTKVQNKDLIPIVIDKTVEYDVPSKDISIVGMPFDGFKITYIIDYPNCDSIGNEIFSIDLSNIDERSDKFYNEIASARTFCLASELIYLNKKGLAKGASLENGVVYIDNEIDNNTKKDICSIYDINIDAFKNEIINNFKLNFTNEAIRHKILDLIGDLYLLGRPIQGHIIAKGTGHSSNVEFIKKIAKEFRVGHDLKKYKYDISDILKILHHRYPFLLIDEITELIPDKTVKAVKNVTFNEPYFQGHFPGKPIMPGVLIVEAMAQSGGFLLLHTVGDPAKKLVIFSRINSAKFKKMIYPGDVVHFEIDLVSYKMNTCKLSGRAIVKGEVVAESEFMATVMDKEF